MLRPTSLVLSTLVATLCAAQCVTSFPSTQNFTSGTVGTPGTLPSNWSNLGGDDLNWNVDNNGTNGGNMSIATGPIGDHTSNNTGGKYMYVEADASGATPGKTAILQSQCWNIAGLTSPYLTFWYHMRGTQMGSLTVDVDANGSVTSNVWTQSGDHGLKWRQGWVNLAPWAGQTNLRVRFRAITGTGALSDIAIDDVEVRSLTPVPGCPDPLASNYNGAVNLNDGSCAYQCPTGQKRVTIDIVNDNYAGETSWTLKNSADGTLLASGTSTGTSLCVPTSTCLVFRINDSAGDGIWHNSYGYGQYWVYLDGALVKQGGQFGAYEETSFNCGPGQTCATALTAQTGVVYTAPMLEYWYDWTPAATGSYTITTCGLNSCDTKLWLYDFACGSINLSSGLEGSTFADDDLGGCGTQAVITANMPAGQTYHIRVGTNGGSCSTASFRIDFNGAAVGCMDQNSCNFDPLATVACSGCCLPVGDPACPEGPDLTINQNALANSLSITTVNIAPSDVCAVEEGCVKGFGTRNVIRFNTRIDNIGELDYYIGSPTSQPGMFDTQNCHGHAHYSGYADYLLFGQDNEPMPVGFKNGYCVIDVGCFGGTSHYGCSNMGISAQCYDQYGSGTTCNWIDITDVPAGLYTLVLRTNWARRPDALGRHETNYANNYGAVCINITGNPGEPRGFNVATGCTPVVDCLNQPYGSALPDCTGACNGPVKTGDVNENGAQEISDAQMYVNMIIGNDATATPCTDLNDDGVITVTDAALMANCNNRQANHDQQPHLVHYHPWCSFPRGYLSIPDTVDLTIGAFDPNGQYVDIWVKNSACRTMGFEFTMSGLTIQSVTNLDPQVQGDLLWAGALGGTKVVGICYNDSSLAKHTGFSPLCRINYFELTGAQICIASIQDIVNNGANNVVARIVDGCLNTGNAVAADIKVLLEGPYQGAGMMDDALRTASLVPGAEPYTTLGFTQTGGGGEVLGAGVLDVVGNNAIVDWVLVELRNAQSPAQVVATRCGLLQRDGDIVSVDGMGSLILPAVPGSYHVAVRHRNHFGVMTASPVVLSGSSTAIDFTQTGTATWGTDARKNFGGGLWGLWSGNTRRDGNISLLKYTGGNNDRDPILVIVGSSTPTAIVAGYSSEDANLNGVVKYTGNGNDRDPILVNVGSILPNGIRTEQLP
ncbi:MAG: hypothetical protein JST41_05135 [Bacteroidetes bacterium]|nr:hypothetical protein [Bacteroidota bacterium]MCC6654819.1 hypothetical protein [Flavobacteriales bacterium]HNK67178.1 lysyl oxidase family protein [Flavobacteriales bacterium]HNM69117.1 lysyl oxidase family protein [Flavobacteriales bacterium]